MQGGWGALPARESAFMGACMGTPRVERVSQSPSKQLIRDLCHGQRRPEAAAEALDQPLPRSLAVCAAGAPRWPHHAARTPRRRVRPAPQPLRASRLRSSAPQPSRRLQPVLVAALA